MEICRNNYLKKLIVRMNNGFIKVITGIRRSGKSYLLNTIFYNYLTGQGISADHIIKFAFDSADNLQAIGENARQIYEGKRKVDPVKFMDYINSRMTDGGMYYLLLDEVQFLGGFESVLNGYLRKDNMDVYVTGSNSKFLSSDILTEFAGRGDEIRVLPLSFSEFYGAYGGSKEYAFDDYLVYGGLPAVVLMAEDEQKIAYLETQMNNVYLRDILSRYNLHSDGNMAELLDILASGISTLVNPKKLSDTFKSVKNSTISPATIANYIGYLEDAFIVKRVKRYDVKGKRYIDTPYKIYFEDTGLRNARLNFRQTEQTHLMENVIFNELRYRGYNVDVGMVELRTKNGQGREQKRQCEVDFVANKGSKRYYLQSAYQIFSEDKYAQETRPFDKIDDSFKKIIITERSMKPRRDEKGYVTMGVKEFLLDENSLEL